MSLYLVLDVIPFVTDGDVAALSLKWIHTLCR